MIEFFNQQSGGAGSLTILLLLIWGLPWKAFAMWRAAKLEHKRWFVVLLILNTMAIVEIAYLLFFNKEKKKKQTIAMKFVKEKAESVLGK